MSKKEATWLDSLQAESQLPTDDFTWTDASTFGLDGFHFEQTMNEGVLNHGDQSGMAGPMQVSSIISEIPDDLFGADDIPEAHVHVGFEGAIPDEDVSFFFSEEEGARPMSAAQRKAASLADLDWLDPTQEIDPKRLPKELLPDRPPLNSIPDLEDAWGHERRTDGVHLIPNSGVDVAHYEEGMSALPGVDTDSMKTAFMRAVRQAHYREPLDQIKRELAIHVQGPAYARMARVLDNEYGLLGTVYVQASAFPGLKQGRGLDMLKKVARTARYVVTKDDDIARKLGKKAVWPHVKWDKAAKFYMPRLRAAGYAVKVAGEHPHPDYRETLRAAILAGPAATESAKQVFPVDVRPADRVSTKDARDALAATPTSGQVKVTSDHGVKAAQAKVMAEVAAWMKAGHITREEALRLAHSTAEPHKKRQVVRALVRESMVRQRDYDGCGTGVRQPDVAPREAAFRALGSAEHPQDTADAEVASALRKKAQLQVARMVRAGQITKKEARVAVSKATAEDILQTATAIVQQAGQKRKPGTKQAKMNKFTGPHFTRASRGAAKGKKISKYDQMVMKAASDSGIAVQHFRKAEKWVRQAMSEGVAGKALTGLIRARFSPPLCQAMSPMVKALRVSHEGLSGFLYVDVDAYASPTGTKGCDENASKHRANQIKFILPMDRCAGCSAANVDGVCRKYGKKILAKVPPGAEQFRAKMIAASDAPDYVNTASLFDPGEFGLRDPLSGVLDLEDHSGPQLLDIDLTGGEINL